MYAYCMFFFNYNYIIYYNHYHIETYDNMTMMIIINIYCGIQSMV